MEEYIKHCRNTDEEGVPVAWSEGRVRSLKELPRERDLNRTGGEGHSPEGNSKHTNSWRQLGRQRM